ncbi:MAG: hypothetical protein GX628_03580 [Clostridiales bacterium]|mgnify:CR=1 FL=1|nr:hypothetical protein [Clostridiales bacterium]
MKHSIFIRLTALLLTALMCAGFAACSSGGDEAVTTTAAAGETTAAESELTPEEQRNAISDDLPERDFDGYNYRFYWFGTDFEYDPEAETGDVINDAAFTRNRIIEERFNIEITNTCSGDSWSGHTTAVRNSVLAGEEAFDVTFDHIIGGPNNSLEGIYLNFYDIPYIDFDKPWWQDNAVKEMTVLDQMYCSTNDYLFSGIGSCKIIYVNRDRLEDYNLEIPYQEVHDHKWTFDMLINLTKDVYEDVNGDGKTDNGDFYGYISHASQNGFLLSFEVPILTKSDEHGIEITVNSEKTVDFFNKVYDWYYNSIGTNIISGNDPETKISESAWQMKLFSEARSLFAFGHVSYAGSTLRTSDVNYGFLPFPLWDENQDTYITFCGGILLSIPITCSDTERAGIIFEAMSAEGYKQLVPAYFETAMKEKFTYDNESVQMLDLINSTRGISFAYAYDNWEGFGHMTRNVTVDYKNNFASYYASRISSATARIEKIASFFEAHAS